MIAEGWKKKIINIEKDGAYRSWYYRARKKGWVVNHRWHLDHPEVYWYKEREEDDKL